MKNITRPIEDLIPDPRNARKHPAEQISRLIGSIKEFGFLAPILINSENRILAGHGRVEAARKAGLKDVPCLQVEHLTETQQRAYVLADNRLAQMAEWDMEIVANEMAELAGLDFDLELTGFDSEEVKAQLADIGEVDINDSSLKTMEEQAGQYEDSAFRQIVLIYHAEEYERVIDAMGDCAEKNGLTDNTQVVNHLLETKGYAVSRKVPESD